MFKNTTAPKRRFICAFGSFLLLGSVSVPGSLAAESCSDFTCTLRTTAEEIVKAPLPLNKGRRGNLGWCENGTFTRDLMYMNPDVKISRKPTGLCAGVNTATSCNGAVFEILVEALNKYSSRPGSASVTVPAATWQNTSLADLRAHIFMYEPGEMSPFSEQKIKINGREFTFNKGSNLQDFSDDLRRDIRAFESKSIAHALNRFGLADSITAAALRPGDVLTFNRDVKKVKDGVETDDWTGTQHSVIFMGWVGQNQEAASFAAAKGFKYVSSQSNPNHQTGFGLRWAYFSGFCPQDPENRIKPADKRSCPDQRKDDNGRDGPNFPPQTLGQKSDCCVTQKEGGLTSEGLKAGRLRDPSTWSARFNELAPSIKNDLDDLEARATREKAAWREAKKKEITASMAAGSITEISIENRRLRPNRELTSTEGR
jgi:hypothetical protein